MEYINMSDLTPVGEGANSKVYRYNKPYGLGNLPSVVKIGNDMTNGELTESPSRDTKCKSGGSRAQRWDAFIKELRAYIEEHHHGPLKHTSLLNAIKHTRKKIREGTLEDWKVEQFREIEGMRDMEEHTGGRKKTLSISPLKGED